jgi:hypothetical protein
VYGALVNRYSKKMLGRVPQALGVYWHNRPVLKTVMGVGAQVQKWNACDQREPRVANGRASG